MEQLEDTEVLETPKIMKYTVRPGTEDLGRQYEFKVTTLMCLRCVLSVEDFWISSNADGVGAFDDIVLRQGNKTFMLQLKHKSKPKSILEQKFLEPPKGDFSLYRYFPDITKLKGCMDSKTNKPEIINYVGDFNDIYFILFTNRGVQECKLVEQSTNDVFNFLNTGSSSDMYKMNAKHLPDNLDSIGNIYLFTNQIHENGLDEQIRKEVQKIIDQFGLAQTNIRDVAVKFTKFVTEWAGGVLGGHYCLSKKDILCRLTDLLLPQYEMKLGQERYCVYTDQKGYIWNEIIRDKIVTVVDFDESVCRFLCEYVGSVVEKYCTQGPAWWNDDLSVEAQNLFYKQWEVLETHMLKIVGNRGKISLMDVYKCLWMDNKVPLLLEINNEPQYVDVLNILKLSCYRFKVVIVNKTREYLPPQINELAKCFYTLRDVSKIHRSKVLQQTVKFQGRAHATLQNLIDENMYQRIKCRDIIHILQDNFNIGNQLNPLPDYFITRTTTRIFLGPQVLKLIKTELFLIESPEDQVLKQLPIEQSKICTLENYDVKSTIIICKSGVVWEQLQNLHTTTRKIIHLLVIHDAQHLEWKTSLGSVKNIKKFQITLDVAKTNSTTHPCCRANMISAAPGMGKSMFMDYVALSAPLDKWVIRIDLNGHQQYYKSPDCKTAKAAQHLKYFKKSFLTDSGQGLDNEVFRKFMQAKDVVVLLDGFDEISPFYKEEVVYLAKCLYEEGYCIWLTTRPHMTGYLEDQFNTFSISLTPFTASDQKEFLTKYFSTNSHSNSNNFLNEFVDKLLQAARKNLNDNDAEFMGIPLQTKLLADVFNEDCKNYILNNGSVQFQEHFDLIYLYQTFIDKKSIFYTKDLERQHRIYVRSLRIISRFLR